MKSFFQTLLVVTVLVSLIVLIDDARFSYDVVKFILGVTVFIEAAAFIGRQRVEKREIAWQQLAGQLGAERVTDTASLQDLLPANPWQSWPKRDGDFVVEYALRGVRLKREFFVVEILFDRQSHRREKSHYYRVTFVIAGLGNKKALWQLRADLAPPDFHAHATEEHLYLHREKSIAWRADQIPHHALPQTVAITLSLAAELEERAAYHAHMNPPPAPAKPVVRKKRTTLPRF